MPRKSPAQLDRDIAEALSRTPGSNYRLFYLTAGKRSLSPEEFSSVEAAARAVRFFKARGFTAWVEDDTGTFVPVEGAKRKPRSL